MSHRTRILFLFALVASVLLAVQMHNATIPCGASAISLWDAACQSVFGHRADQTMFLYCATSEPSRLSTAFSVIAWFAFGGAAVHSATVDLSRYLIDGRADASS